ncbi:hypothetical protein [Kitasatospora purpeofusca]|uniref:Tetratricopeptide repeat protein n=1 Tax=Kitasatospora purpeofusca TaxID=67352 RepID=A0ABZ1UBC2_9ACTN|nr:hypothetical protein [Kitasatospora purpeofusca]
MDPLDILLAGGGIRAAGPTPLYDLTAGRRRIAEKLATRRAERHRAQETDDPAGTGAGHEGWWRTVPVPQLPRATRPGHDGPPPFSGPGGQTAEPSPADAQGLTYHDHADRYLRALAGVIIAEDGAADALKRLHDGTVEPHGALVFACLLHLVGRYQEAQFWWQFAGGAENAAACLCLYLHHVRLGETKAAEHWFAQATRPETLPPGHPATAALLPPVPGYHLACLPLVSDYLTALGAAPHPPDPALREALDDLDIVRDAEYGPISLPSDDLAGQLHDLATTS